MHAGLHDNLGVPNIIIHPLSLSPNHLDLRITPSACGTHSHIFPSNLHHFVTQPIPNFVLSQIQMVGSETQRVDYYIGYP